MRKEGVLERVAGKGTSEKAPRRGAFEPKTKRIFAFHSEIKSRLGANVLKGGLPSNTGYMLRGGSAR